MPGKAFKLTNAEGQRRYGVVVHSIEDVNLKGTEKFPSLSNISDISLVLEEDGTIVENDDHLMSIPDQTVIMMLKPGEVWQKRLSADGMFERLTPAESDRVRVLASRIRRQGVSTFITFSIDDFQLISCMLAKDLAPVLGESEEEAKHIQEMCRERTFQRQVEKEAESLALWFKSYEATRNKEVF